MLQKSWKKSRQKGFTLIELMIVVAIIGIISAMALPGFYLFAVKSKRAEAQVGLAQIYMGEISFFANSGYFTPSMNQVGIKMGGKPNLNNGFCIEGVGVACGSYYNFSIPVFSSTAFIAHAIGWPDPKASNDDFVVLYP